MKISNVTQLSGRLFPTAAPTEIQVSDGCVQSIRPAAAGAAGESTWLVPGFFDLQVNGFAGVDFCDPSTTLEQLEHAARAMLATGVTRFLPTIITADLDNMCQELENISTGIEESPLLRQMCPGAHVEGPFIHPDDGPRGAHPRQFVRPPSIADFDRLYQAARGRIAILTVAADQPGAPELIAHATARSVLVAIGHHRAEAAHIEAALAAGARMCTHLGNGLDASVPRLDNPLWRQLGEDRLWASFIADGHHLPPATLKSVLRAKTPARSVLVTDAMTAAGMPPGIYQLGPIQAERTSTGRVVLPGTPYLAGSAADIPLCIRTAVQAGGLSFCEAVQLAALNPAHLLLREPLDWAPRPGGSANLVQLQWDPAVAGLTLERVVSGAFVIEGVASRPAKAPPSDA